MNVELTESQIQMIVEALLNQSDAIECDSPDGTDDGQRALAMMLFNHKG